MRILIADGDKEFRERTQAFLLRRDHDVKVAANGLECVEILRDFLPETVLLDCQLLWGGYQGVLAWMSDNPNLSRIASILIVDNVPLDALDDLANPMHLAWLLKPFRLDAILNLIETDSGSLSLAQNIRVATRFPSLTGGEK